jgi:hypothetical protein
MSEYQYYEFRAIDRRLTKQEIAELRTYSTRARITPTSFVNEYSFGDFRGDEDAWMEEHFDAFIYLANWGTHIFKLSLPARALDLATARLYCAGPYVASVREKNGKLIFTFVSQEEGGDGWVETKGVLASLMPVRADLARGDLRALYLAWLLRAQDGDLKDGALEPPVPVGLAQLSPALESFAEFLRIDIDLVAAAAMASSRRRSVAELRRAGEQAAEERERISAQKAAKAEVRRERAAARARAKHLDQLAGKEPTLWAQVDGLVATMKPKSYDQAVELLVDLRDLAHRSDGGDFQRRLEALRDAHPGKRALTDRMRKAGM